MSVREKIVESLKSVFLPGEVAAGQVYKGYSEDGVLQASGWWFSRFNDTKIFLGRNLSAAQETIEQIKSQQDEW